jgi:predicted enzyme related to lactoylglutathione lyase
MMRSDEFVPLAVELFVPDVAVATAYYRDVLGFSVKREDDGFAVVTLGSAVIMLAHQSGRRDTDQLPPEYRGGAIDTRIIVPDVDETYRVFRENGVTVHREIGDRDYGLRDFIIKDLNGFRLRLASPVR